MKPEQYRKAKRVFFEMLELGYEFGLSHYFKDHEFDTDKAKNNLLWITLGATLF